MTSHKAEYYDRQIYLRNRPLTYLIIEMVGKLGKVVFVPKIGYFINDPDIGAQVLRNPETFNNQKPGSIGFLITQVLGEFSLINMDGLDHSELKNKLRGLFTPGYLNELLEHVASAKIAQLKADLEAGKTVDLVKFMNIFAGRMITGMLGGNLEDDAECIKLAEAVNDFTAFAGLGKQRLSENEVEKARSLVTRITEVAKRSFETNQSDRSITQRLRDMGFEFEQIKNLMTVILVGGTELVSHAVPRILALLVDSGQIKHIQDNPELFTKAIEEGLRFISPSSIILRAVGKDTEIEGYKFKSGRRVLIVNYHMLKSPKYFENPRKFDINRDIPSRVKHTWFGGGPHFCLGLNLAQMEIRTVLQTLIELDGKLEITSRSYLKNKVFPGYSNLEIKLIR